MACRYNYDHLTHKCQMWSEEDKDHINSPEGADEEGYCTADEDEDPSWCGSYDSDGWDDGEEDEEE